jgi:tetratricopeptide (TPR) repeat protein
MDVTEKNTFWRDKISPLYVESIDLMTIQNDWNGLAASYGQQAIICLFDLQKFDTAMDLLRKDLLLIDQHHLIQYESGVYGRMSLAYQGMLQNELNEASPSIQKSRDLFDLARETAQKAFDVAARLENAWDVKQAQSSLDKLENELKPRVDAIPV